MKDVPMSWAWVVAFGLAILFIAMCNDKVIEHDISEYRQCVERGGTWSTEKVFGYCVEARP